MQQEQRAQARKAGWLYLMVGIFGGFSQGYVPTQVYVAGDAAATSAALLAHGDLLRWGAAADFIQALAFLYLALALYRLFQPVRAPRALGMLVLVALAVGVMVLSAALGLAAGLQAARPDLALALSDLAAQGRLSAQLFFGLWLVPLGLLGWESGYFHRWLSGLLIAGGVAYLINLATLVLSPPLGQVLSPWLLMVPGVAEVSAVFYLLIVGVRRLAEERAPA